MNTLDYLTRASRWSNYLRRRLDARPELAEQLQQDCTTAVTNERIVAWLAALGGSLYDEPIASVDQCREQVRLLRQRVFCTLLVRDINGLASLEEVTQSMSFLADVAVQMAYRSIMNILVENHGAPIDPQTEKPMEMLILGMGKLGGQELNVSSDIDLIMLYGCEGETSGRRPLSYHEFYGRLTQRMMPIISDPDHNGFVFRTDLRLRPDGDGSPLAWSLDALENYLVAQGREWERYAWLKSRLIHVKFFADSDPTKDKNSLKSLRTPFVYRKYFDFDALSSLRGLREQIRDDWQRKADSQTGVDTAQNVKLGGGGIREIEFTVQLMQLIRGGRMPDLQRKGLLDALRAEVRAGLFTADEGGKLEQAYRFLRRLEHIIQYRDDAQTHLLPNDEEGLNEIAAAVGLPRADFDRQLQQHRQFVSATFSDAFRIVGMKEEVDEDSVSLKQEAKRYENTDEIIENYFLPELQEQVHERIALMLKNHRIKNLSEQNRKRLLDIIPNLLIAAAKTSNPRLACKHLIELIETIAQRSSYIALLNEYPDILLRVARIMTASPWAAQYLIQNPLLLDSLIDWRTMLDPVNIPAAATQLHHNLDSCMIQDDVPDVERQMNLMRDLQKLLSFQLLAQDLEGELTVEALADYLSALADMLLEESLYRCWGLIRSSSKVELPEKPKFAVIAYGKLGGKELGYASDLDLVLLYDDEAEYAVETYAKLGRRLSTWVSTMTSSGRMYEMDLRLRPDGDAGLLAVSIDGFEKYQLEHAWVWEHQALTRARFSTGDTRVGEKFEQVRRKILLQTRKLDELRNEIVKMRIKMRDGHPNKTHFFDIKHDKGGMVDIEFITQYLVLAHAAEHPKLLENLGNIALLRIAADAGFIPLDLATQVADAYRLWRKLQHKLRLRGDEKARIEVTSLRPEKASVKQLWKYVFPNSEY